MTPAPTAQVFQWWSALSQAPSWTLGRTLPSSQSAALPSGQASGIYADDSSGTSNYNALYTTFRTQDWHGVTTLSNFTWGRALGTGNESQATSEYTTLNPYNVRQSMYGPQFFDYKFTYTQTFLWSEPFFRAQKGFLGHALGGWRIAPIFTVRSGAPLAVATLNSSESFGETQTGGTNDGAVLASKFTGGSSAIYNINVPNSPTRRGHQRQPCQRRKQYQYVLQSGGSLQRVQALHPGIRHQLRIGRPDSRFV